MTKQEFNPIQKICKIKISRILFSGRERDLFLRILEIFDRYFTMITGRDDALFSVGIVRDSMFRSRNFFSRRRTLHIESYKSRLPESTVYRVLVARGHSDATLTLPDAITRGETWRTSECTQCLPYWLACSLLRNVINTSLTHVPNPAARSPSPRNVQPYSFYSAATALRYSFSSPTEGICTHTRNVAVRNTRTYY